MVLVDTPLWSLALRRRAVDLGSEERRFTQTLYELIREGRVQLLGATRQEVLSGIREETQFLKFEKVFERSRKSRWRSKIMREPRKSATNA